MTDKGIDTEPEFPPVYPEDNRLKITDPTLLAFRARIAELRSIQCHVTANIMRDELLSQLETWLDPDTARLRARAFPVRSGKAMAAEIDQYCGF